MFLDPDWVERWDVAFADLYLGPLADDLAGRPVPGPWGVAFRYSKEHPEAPALRHLLLGMNAHINFDLPQALLAVISDEDFADPDVLRRLCSPTDRALAAVAKVNAPEIAAWVTPAAREPDPNQRRALYRNVQHKVLDKVYAIPVYVLPYTIAAVREAHGIAIDTHGFPTFQDAWLAH